MIDAPEDESPPLLQLLPLSGEAGAYRVPETHVVALWDAAEGLDFIAVRIDLSDCTEAYALLVRVAQALKFPDWFGYNWDALADCLSDLEWLGDAGGYLLLFQGSAALHAAAPDEFATLIEVIDEVAAAWHDDGVPFWGFVEEPSVR